MSIFIQEVLGLLKRNKKKTTLDKDRDYFEFGKLATTSRINTAASYIAQMEPFTIKYQDLFCDLRQDLTLTVADSGVEGKIPVYTAKDAICSLDSLKDSIMTQTQDTKITIAGSLTVNEDTSLKKKVELGTSGDVTEGTTFFNKVLDSAGAAAGAANRILISLADGRVVWSDDDPSGVNGSGTVNHIAMWKSTTGIGNADHVPMIQSGTGASAALTIGDSDDQSIVTEAVLYVNGPLKDSGGTLGTAGQILRADSSSQLKWTSTMIAGLNFNDDVKLTFGDVGVPGDLEIFHNAANSVIKDTGTGSLMIQGSNLILQASLTKNAIICGDSDSVDIYYNGVLKLQTANTGIKITGGILDVNDQLGTAGQVLSSTGTTLDWIDAANASDTLATVTGRGASTAVASTFSGGLTSSGVLNVSGSGQNGYLYVSGNAGNPSATTPTHAQGLAFAYNNSGGSRECEIFWNTGTTTAATNNASFLGFYNEFLNSAAGNARVTDTQLKLYGTGELELVGNTPTVSNAYWRMPTVAAPNTGYVLAKSSGSINLEWVPNAKIYKVYTALVLQTGTNAPTATVLENTTGATIAWTRNSTGRFIATASATLFTIGKTLVSLSSGSTSGTDGKFLKAGGAGTTTVQTIYNHDTNTNASVDGIAAGSMVEFRIYP